MNQAATVKFDMGAVTDAHDVGAQMFLVYSVPKFGKTTLVCGIPRLFIICPEEGLKGIDKPAPHFPRAPRNLAEIYEALDAFERGNQRDPATGQRRFAHLAIDSLSWIQTEIHQTARAELRKKNLDADFKEGWGQVSAHWDAFVERIVTLRRRNGVHIWLVAHAEQRQEATLDGDSFPKWDLQLHKNAAALWRRTADHVFFGEYATRIRKGGKGRRTIGQITARVLRTREAGTHFAGSRSSVPDPVPATWPDLQRALTAGAPAPAERLRASIEELLPKLDPEDRASIERDLGAARGPGDLARVLSRAEGLAAVARAGSDDDDEDDGLQAQAAPAPVQPEPARAPAAPEDDEEPGPAPLAEQRAPARAEADWETEARRMVDGANTPQEIGRAKAALAKMSISVEARRALMAELQAKSAGARQGGAGQMPLGDPR